MTGILVVTHANLGQALIETVEFITGSSLEQTAFISIDIKEQADVLLAKIKKGIKSVQDDNGVLIFTDMFGGTPSNLSYSFLDEGKVEVISGVNLPLLLRASNLRTTMDVAPLAESLVEFGKKSISLASGILKGSRRD